MYYVIVCDESAIINPKWYKRKIVHNVKCNKSHKVYKVKSELDEIVLYSCGKYFKPTKVDDTGVVSCWEEKGEF